MSSETKRTFISRADVRFIFYIFGAVIPVVIAGVIWATQIQAQVDDQDEEDTEIKEDIDLIQKDVILIRDSQIRIETTLGISSHN